MLIQSATGSSALTVINPAHVVVASAMKRDDGSWHLHVEFTTGRTPIDMTDNDERRVRQFMEGLSRGITDCNEQH